MNIFSKIFWIILLLPVGAFGAEAVLSLECDLLAERCKKSRISLNEHYKLSLENNQTTLWEIDTTGDKTIFLKFNAPSSELTIYESRSATKSSLAELLRESAMSDKIASRYLTDAFIKKQTQKEANPLGSFSTKLGPNAKIQAGIFFSDDVKEEERQGIINRIIEQTGLKATFKIAL